MRKIVLANGPLAAVSLAAVLWVGAGSQASGAVSAYWRHEEGAVGALIPAGPDAVLDSSGNGNHMRTFDPAFTSGTYSNVVSPVALRSGAANTRSLNFGPGGDDAGQNDDNYSELKPINTQRFGAMTVELAFNMNFVGGYQALFGKDGKPTDSPVPPLKVLIRGDDFPDAVPNQLFVEFIDGTGTTHFVTSRQTIAAGQWYHVAFTLTTTSAELWVAGETGPYTRLDAITESFGGPNGEALIDSEGTFSIGRGMFNGGVADWSDGLIDEVRVSDVALAPGQFEFAAPVPEPGCLGVLGLTGAALGRRRQ